MPSEKTLHVRDMSCAQCERNIERALQELPCVEHAEADHRAGTVRIVVAGGVPDALIAQCVADAGYTVETGGARLLNGISLIVIAAGVVWLLDAFGATRVFQSFPMAQDGMGVAGFFTVGLLTSVHCLSMCGGLAMLSVAGDGGKVGEGGEPVDGAGALHRAMAGLRSPALYNLGRILSYACIGALLGALGSAFSVSLAARAVLGAVVALLMVVVGLSLTGYAPWARKLQLHLPAGLRSTLVRRAGGRPLLVGLGNGLMPCGPLQTMQLIAITSGGAVAGALDMAAFCLGTIPLMLAFGFAAGKLTSAARGVISPAAGFLIMVFGFYLLANSLALQGVGIPSLRANEGYTANVQLGGGVQDLVTVLEPGEYSDITVKSGIPVRWTIRAGEGALNGCNNELVINAFGVRKKLEPGDNVIEFTPQALGEVGYSCWMGMIKATITVE